VSVGREVEDGGLLQRGFTVGDNPAGVEADVAVRGPGGVEVAVEQQECGALGVLRGVEDDVSAVCVVAGAGIGSGDLGGAAGEFGSGGEVERMEAPEESLLIPTVKRVPLVPLLRSITGVEVMPISGVI
jgi:hypothetical protein